MKECRKSNNFKDYKKCIKHSWKDFENKKMKEKKNIKKQRKKTGKWIAKSNRKYKDEIQMKTHKMIITIKAFDLYNNQIF